MHILYERDDHCHCSAQSDGMVWYDEVMGLQPFLILIELRIHENQRRNLRVTNMAISSYINEH
jgi:hypothetical protein